MPVRVTILLLSLLLACVCHGQQRKDSLLIDTTLVDYDELISEIDALLDSLTTPRSFTVINVGIGNGYFNYTTKGELAPVAKKQFTYSPSASYFDKTGLGLSAGATLINDGTGFNPYQFSLTGSYDYLRVKSFITGLSLTHYFTKADVPFYTSPLQNEAYAYFTYRKSWFKPSVAVSYGWGSRNDFQEREEVIQNIQLAQRGFTRINTQESLVDFSLSTSIRHDFYFLNTLSKSDYVRFTPQLSFTSGTQQFGFNQTSNTFATVRRSGRNVLYSTENISLDDQLYFQPVSLTGFIKTEYAKGKFFLQPQLMFDYYFPAANNNFTTSFAINAGIVF